ncbi:MAG: antibiotic biosynthesis monooxygenase [Deltaproteobacteria bacterium]|nr:antibiotic biosynthesis monooxygenase [Deltaproteobacteria bacterium]
MLRAILTLKPRPGARDAAVSVYRESGIFDLAVREAGCLAAELQVPADPEGPVVVTSLWKSRADYETWGAHPARADLAGRLVGLLSDARLDEYEVILRTAPE